MIFKNDNSGSFFTKYPIHRKLISINPEKVGKDTKANEKLFETLMGKQAELRFKFIQKNANFIKNLDI